MIDELQVVFERQVAITAVKPRSATAFAHRRARGYQHGLADGGGDVEPAGARGAFMRGGGGGWRVVVFSAEEFGLVVRFAACFFTGFTLRGESGVSISVPCSAERGVGLGVTGLIILTAAGRRRGIRKVCVRCLRGHSEAGFLFSYV